MKSDFVQCFAFVGISVLSLRYHCIEDHGARYAHSILHLLFVCVCVRVLNICVLFTNYDIAALSCQIENFKGNRESRYFMNIIWLIDSNYDGLHRFWSLIALILYFIVVALFLIFNHVHLPRPLPLSLLTIDRLIASALRRNISLTHLDLERLEEI